MKLDEYVYVGGKVVGKKKKIPLAGKIYKLAGNRDNGLFVQDLDSNTTKFASSNSYQFTPLASIAIYTNDDSTELSVIFKTMLEQMESNPPVKPNDSSAVLHEYFRKILPDYDNDKVHASDIKKVIKWFNFLNDRNLIDMEDEPTDDSSVENKTEEEASEKES